jgi:hypothetical protein
MKTAKKSTKTRAETNAERLAKPSFPLPRFIENAKVQVYMGGGWSIASVVESRQDRCSVRLAMGNRLITVFDARSIRSANGAEDDN